MADLDRIARLVARARAVMAPPGRAEIETYWQSYLDLAAAVASGGFDADALIAHYCQHGTLEGRRYHDPRSRPEDWSETLYFAQWKNAFEPLWRDGTLATGYWSGITGDRRSREFGRMSLSRRLQDMSGLAQPELARIVEHALAFPGSGPLRDLAEGPLAWSRAGPARLLDLEARVTERFPGGADVVVALPWLKTGGAERVGLWHHDAATAAGLRSVILLADDGSAHPRHAGLADRIVDLPALFDELSGTRFLEHPPEERVGAVLAVLAALRPRQLWVTHSHLCYLALADPASARKLRATVDEVLVSTFCPHIHPSGVVDGFFRFIPEIFSAIDRLVFDNNWYRDELAGLYGLPAEKTAVLRYPVERIEPVEAARGAASRTVLWASRLDAQKNPAILAPIAARLPGLRFVAYGSRVMGDAEIDWAAMPSNVTYCGGFSSPDELPLGEVMAFLYTSRFDGMPNVVLEVGARGVPIVCPRVGGIGDFLGGDWPFYVSTPQDIEGYVAGLARLRDDAGVWRAASERLVSLAREDRSVGQFRRAIAGLLPAERHSGEWT